MQTITTSLKSALDSRPRALKLALLAGFVPFLAACNGSATGVGTAHAQTNEAATIAALQKRVQRLEDIHAIKKLTRAYGYYVDKNLWNQVADLYAKNATLEISERGIFVGQDSIRRSFLQGFGGGKVGLPHGRLFNHIQVEGIVDVAPDGKTAKARWRAIVQVANYNSKSAMLSDGIYENEYVKDNGVWMFSKMRFWPTYYTPYHQGWDGKQAICINGNGSGMSKGAQKPSTDNAGVFPDVYTPPFHYVNPVTGKAVDVSEIDKRQVSENIWPRGCGGTAKSVTGNSNKGDKPNG